MQSLKENLLCRVIIFFVAVTFILGSAPVKLYADIAVSHSLRATATNGTSVQQELKSELQNTGIGKTKVAINNPGGQERELIRQWLQGKVPSVDLVGVNGISANNLYYLLTKDLSATYDFREWFKVNFTALPTGIGDKNSKLILPVSEILDANALPWDKLNPQVVIEGENAGLASAHKKRGAQSVIVTNPALTSVSVLMSALSALPHDKIRSVDVNDVQPASSLQRGIDNSGPDPVLMRAMGINIAPALSRDFGVYAQKLIPDLANRIVGKINFAPQISGSIMDIHIRFGEDTSVANINKLFKDASEGALKGVVTYSQDASIVSTDTNQNPQLVFLANITKVTGKRDVHIQIAYNEESAFAASEVPLLLKALAEKKAPDVITAKDQNTAEEAARIKAWAKGAQAAAGMPAFLSGELDYVPSLNGKVRPRVEIPGKGKVEQAIIGINGPGRIGRPVIWALQGDPNVNLRMVNGSSNAISLAWLLSEDSIQQSTPKPVVRVIVTPEQLEREAGVLLANYSFEQVKGLLDGLLSSGKLAVMDKNKELTPLLEQLLAKWGKPKDQIKPSIDWLMKSLVGVLDINGKKVLVVNERKSVSELPWDVAGIKTIFECTGDLKNADEARAHLAHIKGGRVIISAPAEGAGQSIVLGVVEPTRAAQIVDNASCTTNCLMPVVHVLNKVFGVVSEDITTIHSYTTDQKFAQQMPHKKEATRGRDGLRNALSASTGAAKTAGVIIPSLAGNSDGIAVRTPNPTGSSLSPTITLRGKVTKEQIQNALKTASEGELKGILAYTRSPLVSQLILGNPASSIVDGNSINVIDYNEERDETTVSLTAWYDNETGFSNRMVNLAVALQGFSMIKGKVVADIGPETVKLFETKINEINPGTIIWNGPMGVVEVEATAQGTKGLASAIIKSKAKVKGTGGGDTLKTLSEEERSKFTYISTGGGAFLEAFQFGVENLPGIKALIDANGNFHTLANLDLKAGDRVLVRVDHNVPLDSSLNITDNTRIKESLPTIQYLLAKGCKVILMTHVGRPNGKFDAKLKTDPIANELRRLLGSVAVHKIDATVGEPVETFINDKMKSGEILYLENTRFTLDEEQNSPAFSKQLARLADAVVDDAFGTSHRAHASTEGVFKYFDFNKKAAGLLLQKEHDNIKNIMENPELPMIVALAGGKVTDKIPFINALKDKATAFLIGGRMSLAFLVAKGQNVGDSTPDKNDVETARKLLADPQLKDKIILPVDGVVVSDITTGADAVAVKGDVEPSDMSIFREQFFDYLESYLPDMTAEGKAVAAMKSIPQDNSLSPVKAAESAQTPTVAAPIDAQPVAPKAINTPASVIAPVLVTLSPAEFKQAMQTLTNTAYKGVSAGYENVMNTVKETVKNGGTIVIGANAILDNANSVPALKLLKDTGSYEVVVWAQDKAAADALKAMGVDEAVTRIMVGEENGKRVALETKIASLAKPVMLIASPVEQRDINMIKVQEYGVLIQTIEASKAGIAGLINSMPLAISRAVATLADNSRVTDAFKGLSANYKDKVSAEDLTRLNNISKLNAISSVPLVQLSADKDKEVLDAEKAYKETTDKL